MVDKQVQEVQRGIKESDGKLPYELDWLFIQQMAIRMQQSKGKYPPYNWTKPIDIQSIKDALTRHLVEIQLNNYHDGDEQLGHLSAIACNAMILYYQITRNTNGT